MASPRSRPPCRPVRDRVSGKHFIIDSSRIPREIDWVLVRRAGRYIFETYRGQEHLGVCCLWPLHSTELNNQISVASEPVQPSAFNIESILRPVESFR